MGTPSDAARGKTSPLAKIDVSAKDQAKVGTMKKITSELLDVFFKDLKRAPDALYWLMATWGAESSWNLHFSHKGVVTSLHYTPSPPARESVKGMGTISSTGTLIGNGYQYSSVIQNIWNNPLTSLDVKENIKEGWYPHGISACMGTYHVRGCPNNKTGFRSYPEAIDVIDSLGLEVDPGESIFHKLFKENNEESWRKSIASGMIIFNQKYKRALETTHKGNEIAAMQAAIGNYLGKFGKRDNNGVSPEDRVRQLNATNSSIVTMLQAVELRRTGDTTRLAINITNKEAKAEGSTQVSNTQTRVASTNGNSDGKSKPMPGCSIT